MRLELAFLMTSCACVAAIAQSTPASAPHPAFPAGAATPLGRAVFTVLADPEVARAHLGVAVVAMDGTPLFGWNEGQLFRPASNAKLFTTAAAMALLGPETRVVTVVSADAAPDAKGLLASDVTIHGAGDANLSGRHIPYEAPEARKARVSLEHNPAIPLLASEDVSFGISALRVMDDFAAQMALKGVKQIVGGKLIGDQSIWHGPAYAPSWDAGDAIWGYGASVSALEFDDGQLQLIVHPGTRAGDAAWPTEMPDLGNHFIMQATTVADPKDAEIDVEPGMAPRSLVVVGAVALGHPDAEEIAQRDPAALATGMFGSMLVGHNIAGITGTEVNPAPEASSVPFSRQVKQAIPNLTPKPASVTSPICGRDFQCGFVLAEHVSPTLAEDVTITLKVSQNLHAEMMLRRLGRAYGTEGSFAQGARVVRQWLLNAGIDGDDFVFYDGSGLSSHDLVTPRATTSLLTYAAKQPWFAQWKAALPVGGVDGSLSGRFRDGPLKGHVFAKTGTLGESRALSGYVDCASGRTVAFAIFVDTHLPGHSEGDVIDKIVASVAANN